MATMMRMVFSFWLMDHSTIQMATILTKMVMISMAGTITMMAKTSNTSLGQKMKSSIMQTIRKRMEMSFIRFTMRTKSLLQNNIKLRMTTTTLRQTNMNKKRERKSLKKMIMNLN